MSRLCAFLSAGTNVYHYTGSRRFSGSEDLLGISFAFPKSTQTGCRYNTWSHNPRFLSEFRVHLEARGGRLERRQSFRSSLEWSIRRLTHAMQCAIGKTKALAALNHPRYDKIVRSKQICISLRPTWSTHVSLFLSRVHSTHTHASKEGSSILSRLIGFGHSHHAHSHEHVAPLPSLKGDNGSRITLIGFASNLVLAGAKAFGGM